MKIIIVYASFLADAASTSKETIMHIFYALNKFDLLAQNINQVCHT